MTIFFVVSCAVQALSGFVVDRFGPRPGPVRAGSALLGAGGVRLRGQPELLRCWLRSRCVAGHRQRRVPPGRLHAAQPQGQPVAPRPCVQRARHHRQPRLGAGAGDAGAADARVLVARRARLRRRAGVRGAAACCGSTARRLRSSCAPAKQGRADTAAAAEGSFDFLRSRRSGCASRFFFFYAMALSGIQAFAPEAARHAARRAGAPGGDVPDDLHGLQRRRHGGRRLPGGRPGALRTHRRRRLRRAPRWSRC